MFIASFTGVDGLAAELGDALAAFVAFGGPLLVCDSGCSAVAAVVASAVRVFWAVAVGFGWELRGWR